MIMKLTIKKRCGVDPHTLPEGEASIFFSGCPDVFELSDGSYAIIGKKMTNEIKDILPDDASCAADEEIIVVPRFILSNAKRDIPDYKV